MLAEALAGPALRRYRVASGSRPGLSYELTADEAGDIICTCPGFEYRGMCSHALKLKTALVAGGGLPAGFSGGSGPPRLGRAGGAARRWRAAPGN